MDKQLTDSSPDAADGEPTLDVDGYFKHPAAIVESKQIGARTRIWAFAHVLPGAVIGEGYASTYRALGYTLRRSEPLAQ